MPAFFLIWFGAAAVVVGVAVVAFPAFPFAWQIVAWTACSLAFVWLWFRIFKPGHAQDPRSACPGAALIGEIGLVIRDIRPFDKGQIRFQKPILGAEIWESIADEEIRVGERVR